MNRLASFFIGLVNLVLAVVEVLLGLRVIFRLFGASAGSSFVSFVYNVTNGLVAPFRGIITTSPATTGGVVIDWSAIVAMIIYALAAWLLNSLISWIGRTYYADTYVGRTTVIER